MRTQAPVEERDPAAPQPASSRAGQLRATAARIDDLLTDAKSALDRLMQSATAADQPATTPRRATAAAPPATADLLFEDPAAGGTASEFVRLETDDTEMVGDAWSDGEPSSGDGAAAAAAPTTEAMPIPHHDSTASPHDDGRGVLTLALVSMSLLVLAALFGQHFAGIGIVGGANLLAWLVVVQQRRDASVVAPVAH